MRRGWRQSRGFRPNEDGSRPPATRSLSFRDHHAPGFRVLL